jgi:leucyl aminopeptidase
MQVKTKTGSALAATTDCLVVIHAKGERVGVPKSFEAALQTAKKAGDLPEAFRSICTLYPTGRSAQKRLVLISIGDTVDDENLRRTAALAQQTAAGLSAGELVLTVGDRVADALEPDRVGLCLSEGAVLGAYEYDPPRREQAKPKKAQHATLMALDGRLSAAFVKAADHGSKRAAAVCFARDLGNRPANLLTPQKLAAEAQKLRGKGISAKVLDESQMHKLGMGALLSVARGSDEPAKLIVLDYRPAGARKTLCVVGKGLTFDSGGISIKPSAGMDEMRYDMCGSAAVLGLFHALKNAAARPKCRVVGIVAATENMPDGRATKPGDVVRAMNGTTIEVLNTDAEGRLVLADALAYAVKTYKPQAVVDLATLTGAVIIALGHEVTGIMGNDDKLVDEILAGGETSGDRCWRLPLWDAHKEQMKSKFADLKNINNKGDGNGSTAGGAFLSYFVGDTPWVHMDIAGTAWGGRSRDYYRAGASGVGVRALLDWVQKH